MEKGRIKKDPEEKEITTKLSEKTTNKPTKKGHKTQKPHRNTTHIHKKNPLQQSQHKCMIILITHLQFACKY